MSDERIDYYGEMFVGLNIQYVLHITFEQFLTQPEVYKKDARLLRTFHNAAE